jgi:hypothetical protein
MKPQLRITNHKYASDPTDVLVRNYVSDGVGFFEYWEFEAADGKSGYTYCADQDGGDFIKHEWDDRECRTCRGRGRVLYADLLLKCPFCKGAGKIDDETDPPPRAA